MFPYEDQGFISPLFVQPVSSALNSTAVITSYDIIIIFKCCHTGVEIHEETFEL